ncbi:unnamed protein product, partial [Musa acuminata subsp. burmannicoides]
MRIISWPQPSRNRKQKQKDGGGGGEEKSQTYGWDLPEGAGSDGEDATEAEPEHRVRPLRVRGGLFGDRLHRRQEPVQAPNRRHVQRQRHRREPQREQQLQH